MAELSGSLGAFGLSSIVDFLAGRRWSGRLHLRHGDRTGAVSFDGGRVVAASFGAERGLAALEAIVRTLPEGDFAFAAGPPPAGGNIDLGPGELRQHLDRLTAAGAD